MPSLSIVEGRSPDDSGETAPVAETRAKSTPPEGRRRTPAATVLRVGEVRRFGRVVGRSAAMHDLFEALARFARTDVTMTFVGETGAGKDILAHGVHQESSRAHGPLVVFDCGSVAANLAESELLGHERGAFTGAVSAHSGAFERAHGGTLFLDEVAELPLDLQPRLLRALEGRTVRRVGGKVDKPVDVRVIAATNRDLRAEVAAGRFREDLFFRLAVAVLKVPPLRERLDDLPDLVRTLLSDLGRPDVHGSDAAFDVLRAHAWPGNVRELKNVLACAVPFIEVGGGWLEPKHLRLVSSSSDPSWIDGLPLAGQRLELIERAAIRQTLAQTAGNKINAARTLGIAVSTLYEKLKKYGV